MQFRPRVYGTLINRVENVWDNELANEFGLLLAFLIMLTISTVRLTQAANMGND